MRKVGRSAAKRPPVVEHLEGRRMLSASFSNATDNAIGYHASSGKLYLAYYDQSNGGSLKSAMRDSNGDWQDLGTIDSTSGAGRYVSMAIDGNGRPGVAYYYPAQSTLRYAYYNGTSWSWEEADDRANVTAGLYPSIQFNALNRPAISYYDSTHTSLVFIQKGVSAWASPVSVDNGTDDTGRFSSLSLNPNTGAWAIAYEETGYIAQSIPGFAKYVEQGSGGAWQTPVAVRETDAGAAYNSLQFIYNGTNHDPAFSFYDAAPANLMYARRVNGSWAPISVSTNNTQGRYTNLIIQSNNKARIVFQNSNGTSVETISIRDEPANWQTDAWTNTNLLSGGGSGGQAARVSDSEFFYTRVGLNPSSPTLYVSNYPKEGKTWGQKTDVAAFGDRWSHATVSFKEGGVDTMWVIGGALGGFDTDTVYSSTDGQTWTQRTTTGMFSARRNFTANVFNDGTGDKIWAFGGNAGSTFYNDLHYSSDGVTWNQKTTTNVPSARHGHAAVASGGYLYVIGGTDSGGRLNDVWRFDGSDWSQVTAGGGSRFTARENHVVLAYNAGGGEKLWVMGGFDGDINGNPVNDVWSSGDGGATWTQATAGANWADRSGAAATVFDNRMWITGGQTGGPSNYITDAWWSADGANWFSAIDSVQYGARRDHDVLVFKHRLWIVGGAGSTGAGDTVYYAKNGEA